MQGKVTCFFRYDQVFWSSQFPSPRKCRLFSYLLNACVSCKSLSGKFFFSVKEIIKLLAPAHHCAYNSFHCADIFYNCANNFFNRAEMVSFGAIRFRFGAIRFGFGAIRFRFGAIKISFHGFMSRAFAFCLFTVGKNGIVV